MSTDQTVKPRVEKLAASYDEAAEMLGISIRLLKEEYKNWGLPHVRLNGRVVFPVDGLRAWLAEHSIRGAA